MDWIERTLGINPDSGSGVTELAIVVAGLAIVLAVVAFAFRARRPAGTRVSPRGPSRTE